MRDRARDELTFNAASMAARADRLLPDFRQTTDGLPRESGSKGISSRGMFFFYVVVRPLDPKQILESGRMRGESTLMLARCFPQSRIVSVEFNLDPTHAAIAEAKLKPYANVELLYGDSREILPQRLQAGDAILIDGPKEFRALKLALQLLATGKPSAIFIHDFYQGQPAREFVERHWPGAFFSDDPALAARFLEPGSQTGPAHDLDSKNITSPFVCLPPGLPASYPFLLFKIIWARAVSIAVSKLAKLLPHNRRGKFSDPKG
jgi:predicted O-methyltransferase YrrM